MAKKNKLPRKIGGFKVPKTLRRSSLLSRVLTSPMGRDLLANAITAAAGVAAAVLVKEREALADASTTVAKKGARKSKRAARIAGEAVQSAFTALMGVMGDAASNLGKKDGGGKKREPIARQSLTKTPKRRQVGLAETD